MMPDTADRLVPIQLVIEGAMKYGPINILEHGAHGDGVHDDTDAIQDAINVLAARGGGKIFFPFTPKGYRIAKPAQEIVNGRPCRSQLYIPYPNGDFRTNIAFEGEMPCQQIYGYLMVKSTVFEKTCVNAFLFSDWDAPEERNPEARPWSVLGALEGTRFAGKFAVGQVTIRNLEFQVKLDTARLYPTQSAVNLLNVSRINIRDSQFCLDKNVADFPSGKYLLPNPCHTAGLIASGDQNDNNCLNNVSVQGFRYGFVLSEHVVADYLSIHNCERGMIFHDSSHQTVINHVVAQHNQVILATTEDNLFGTKPGPCSVEVGSVDFEAGLPHHRPEVSNMTHGVWDPGHRLVGSLRYHCGCPYARDFFPVEGARYFAVSRVAPLTPFTKQ